MRNLFEEFKTTVAEYLDSYERDHALTITPAERLYLKSIRDNIIADIETLLDTDTKITAQQTDQPSPLTLNKLKLLYDRLAGIEAKDVHESVEITGMLFNRKEKRTREEITLPLASFLQKLVGRVEGIITAAEKENNPAAALTPPTSPTQYDRQFAEIADQMKTLRQKQDELADENKALHSQLDVAQSQIVTYQQQTQADQRQLTVLQSRLELILPLLKSAATADNLIVSDLGDLSDEQIQQLVQTATANQASTSQPSFATNGPAGAAYQSGASASFHTPAPIFAKMPTELIPQIPGEGITDAFKQTNPVEYAKYKLYRALPDALYVGIRRLIDYTKKAEAFPAIIAEINNIIKAVLTPEFCQQRWQGALDTLKQNVQTLRDNNTDLDSIQLLCGQLENLDQYCQQLTRIKGVPEIAGLMQTLFHKGNYIFEDKAVAGQFGELVNQLNIPVSGI